MAMPKIEQKQAASRLGLGPSPAVSEVFIDGVSRVLWDQHMVKLWLYTDVWSETTGEPEDRAAVILTMSVSTLGGFAHAISDLVEKVRRTAAEADAGVGNASS